MNSMAMVYQTTSHDFVRRMEADLVDYYRDHAENQCAGGGGGVGGEAPYVVYVAWTTDPHYISPVTVDFESAFRSDITPITGRYFDDAVHTRLHQIISALTRDGKPFWIGVTSGGVEGCRNRWNNKYKFVGMNSIALVYQTSSGDMVRRMEADLIGFYEEHAENPIGGGGGGQGEPPYFVYVAWRG